MAGDQLADKAVAATASMGRAARIIYFSMLFSFSLFIVVGAVPSERRHRHQALIGLQFHPVAQGLSESRHVDLERIADLRLHPGTVAQHRRPHEIGMEIARPPEHPIAKMK